MSQGRPSLASSFEVVGAQGGKSLGVAGLRPAPPELHLSFPLSTASVSPSVSQAISSSIVYIVLTKREFTSPFILWLPPERHWSG